MLDFRSYRPGKLFMPACLLYSFILRRPPAFLTQSLSLERIRLFMIRQSFARTLQEHTGCSVRSVHSFTLLSFHIEHRMLLATGSVLYKQWPNKVDFKLHCFLGLESPSEPLLTASHGNLWVPCGLWVDPRGRIHIREPRTPLSGLPTAPTSTVNSMFVQLMSTFHSWQLSDSLH